MVGVKTLLGSICAGVLTFVTLPLPVHALDASQSFRYVLTSDCPIVFASDLADGAKIVHVTHRIQGDPGTAAMQLCYTASGALSFEAGSLAEPFCYGDGTPKAGFGTNFVKETGKLIWYTTNDDHNELLYPQSDSFFVLDVCVPQGTQPGMYSISIDADSKMVCNEAREVLDVDVSAAVIEVAAGAPPALYGDVDESGDISADDAVAVLRYYVQSLNDQPPQWSAQTRAAADMNADAVIDADDAVRILQRYAQSLMG